LTLTLVYGWYQYDGDVSYQRLLGDGGFADPKYKDPRDIASFGWAYILPPLVLMVITRFGIPVSTSFLILTFFNPKNLNSMVIKSMTGYLVAFGAAAVLYLFITKSLEKKFVANPIKDSERTKWTIAQWASTGFLWTQWLAQDFANTTFVISLIILLVMLAYIFYSKGGAIQAIVKAKTNTADIRSATFIDLSYGIVLYFFKELNNIPMSTTWVFLGLLAGREIAVRYNLSQKVPKETLKDLGMDLGKVFFGLAISIGLVYLIQWLTF